MQREPTETLARPSARSQEWLRLTATGQRPRLVRLSTRLAHPTGFGLFSWRRSLQGCIGCNALEPSDTPKLDFLAKASSRSVAQEANKKQISAEIGVYNEARESFRRLLPMGDLDEETERTMLASPKG